MIGGKELWFFNKPERRGFFVLTLIIVLLLIFRYYLVYQISSGDNYQADFSKLKSSFKQVTAPKNKPSSTPLSFLINPNKASYKELVIFGLSEDEAAVFLKLRKQQYLKDTSDYERFTFLSPEIIQKLKTHTKSFELPDASNPIPSKKNTILFKFNPNNLPEAKWKLLGLEDWQIKIIKRYEAAGGTFKHKTDLKKIYGISEELYQKLLPYIVIPGENASFKIQLFVSKNNYAPTDKIFKGLKPVTQLTEKNIYKYYYGNFSSKKAAEKMLPFVQNKGFKTAFIVAASDDNKPLSVSHIHNKQPTINNDFVIDINHADTSEFKKIRGIGSKLSARIVKYREKLGGFYNIHQLSEVYGIDEFLIQQNKAHFTCSNNPDLKKININTADYKTLFNHPYISKHQASAIVNYRLQHGLYTSTEELLKIHLIDKIWWEKTAPYLEVR